jgi:hypothetical protein
MSESIKDGKGTGKLAEVDGSNKLQTRAVSSTSTQDAMSNGYAFNINTGDVASLADGESAMLWVENKQNEDMIIDAVAFGARGAAAASNDYHLITIVRNPTSASFSTACDMIENRDFGSAKDLSDSDIYKGANGATLTGGDSIAQLYAGYGRSYFTVDFKIPKNSTMGIKVDYSVSSGTATSYVALIGHLVEII